MMLITPITSAFGHCPVMVKPIADQLILIQLIIKQLPLHTILTIAALKTQQATSLIVLMNIVTITIVAALQSPH